MGPESIVLSVDRYGEEGTYSFVCPVCAGDVEKQADRKIVALLVSAGVPMAGGVGADVDARGATTFGPIEPSPAPILPPLTLDDVIQFHYLLEDDAFLEGLLGQDG